MTTVLVDEPRLYDEERAWLASMADPELLPYGMVGSAKDSWLEDGNLFVDVTTTYNFRDRRRMSEEEPLIYNELILQPQEPLSTFVWLRMGREPVEFQMKYSVYAERIDVLGMCTKAQLMEIVTERKLDHVIKERMLKHDIILGIIYHTS